MYVPRRYIFVVLTHLGFFVTYALRVNLSVAMVAMVNSSSASNSKNHSNTAAKDGEINWDQEMQGLVLSSFFYGYLLTNIPGGWLASKYGGKWVLGIGILWSSVLTLLSPIAARSSPYLLIALRILIGFAEGVTLPAAHAMISKWAPPSEKSRMVVFCYSGSSTGPILTLPIAGMLASSDFLGGWPSLFYVFGIFGLIWFSLWAKFIASSPGEHKSISNEEKKFIFDSQKNNTHVSGTVVIPWLHIFTSVRVWALIIAHFSNNWIKYLVLTDLPSYFDHVLHFSLKENSFLSALPFLFGFIGSIGSGILADFLIKRFLSIKWTRKLMGILAFYPAAGFLLLTGYTKKGDEKLAVVYMILAYGFINFNLSGYAANHLDIAPRFGGVLIGITNTGGTVAGCVTPLVTGYFTKGNASQATGYRWVFGLAAAVAVCGGTFYNVFVTGEQQHWNEFTNTTKVAPAPSGTENETGEMNINEERCDETCGEGQLPIC